MDKNLVARRILVLVTILLVGMALGAGIAVVSIKGRAQAAFIHQLVNSKSVPGKKIGEDFFVHGIVDELGLDSRQQETLKAVIDRHQVEITALRTESLENLRKISRQILQELRPELSASQRQKLDEGR